MDPDGNQLPKSIQIPLLKDHHSHPLFYSAFGQALSLESTATKSAAIEKLHTAFSDAKSGTHLTVAHGWRSNFFQWDESELESFPPIAIFNVSLHSLVINQSGKQILHARYGDVIQNLDDRDWYERNLRTVLNWFANLHASVESLQAFYDSMLEVGVYYLEEMLLVDENEIELFRQAGLMDRTKFWAAPDTFESLSDASRSVVCGLKLFTDGAIGSRTAALNRPYISADPATDNTDSNFGMLVYSDEELYDTIASCLQTGKSLAIHAIGDRAIEQVIKTLENAGSMIQLAPLIRIEHAQLISLEMARRCKDLGVTLCMQPNFSSDSVAYTDRLDNDYCRANNPFRMLIDEVGFVAGKDLIFGSDGMPHGVETATQQSFSPQLNSQRLSIDEFVAGYCMADDSEGSIELEISD